LFSIFVTATGPISAVLRTWVPPQGVQVDPGDLHQAHAAHAARRLDRHRAHELGFGGEFLIGDPARLDRMTRSDQRVEPARDCLLVEARSGYVEIEPSPAIRDLAAGHRTRDDAA
jgi:hypothetical protein